MKKMNVFRAANPGKKFMAYDLEPNEVFSEEYAYYTLDVENFDFKRIDERLKMFDRAGIQKFLDSSKIDINIDEFLRLYNLQSYINMKWPGHAKNRPHREEIFRTNHRGKDNPMWLSDSFNRGIAACIECCLLAQMYLQHCGIESKICCGNAFFEKNPKIEFGGDAHAYMLVRFGNMQYIYDPANPLLDAKGRPTIPRIMSFAQVPFKARMVFKDLLNMSVADGGGFAYVEASDIYGVGSCWLYGFESDDNSTHVSRRRSASGIKRQVVNQESQRQVYQPSGYKM